MRRLGLFEYTGRYDSRLYASFVEGDCFYYTDRVDGRRVVMRYDVAARRRDIVYDGDFTGLKNVFENALYLSRDKTDGDKMDKEFFWFNMETRQEKLFFTITDADEVSSSSVAVLREGEYVITFDTWNTGDISILYKEKESKSHLLYNKKRILPRRRSSERRRLCVFRKNGRGKVYAGKRKGQTSFKTK